MQDLELRARETSPRVPDCLNYAAQFRNFLIARGDELQERNEKRKVSPAVSRSNQAASPR
jgi:hypothetical protein